MKRLFIPLFVAAAVVARAETKVSATATATVTIVPNCNAIAELQPTKGNKVSGTVTFTAVEGGVKVVAELTGLTPGDHGFHIHEKGDCSDPEAKSAGGHFNPGKHDHGGPSAEVRHAGDFGNITANADGKARYERIDKLIHLDGPDTIVGRSVIVHENADDLKSQPSGNAGPRVACGVIRLAK